MNTLEQKLWSEIVAADTPSLTEMAVAEAELRTIGPVAGLSASVVDVLVARATAPADGPGAVVERPRAWPMQKLFQVAAAVLVTLTLGWVGFKVLWPEAINAPHTLNYVEAVKLATQASRGDKVQLPALTIVAGRCGYGIDTISALAKSGPQGAVAREAQRIREELAQLLTNGATAPPEDVDQEPVGPAAMALDASLSDDVRLDALRLLGDLTRSGLTAILIAPLSSEDANLNRRNWVSLLLKSLTD